MQIKLNHDTNIQSNLYLRALYAKLRMEYGKCAWQYMPRKDGKSNSIHIGFVDIGLANTLEVVVGYEKKGVIKLLSLSGDVDDSVDESIRKLAENINYKNELTEHFVSCNLYSEAGIFGCAKGDHYSIASEEGGNTADLVVKVYAFDAVDAKVEAGQYIEKICSALAVFVNNFVKYESVESATALHDIRADHVYLGDPDWIDHHPIQNNKLVLADYQKKLLDKVLTREVKPNFLRGCAHFNNAAHLLKDYSMNKAELTDTASVLYVSALEACSELFDVDISSCKSCGQKVFSIRRRVLDLVRKYHPDHLVKFFDNYYASRSKYLHTGQASSANSYYGSSIPLLDPSSDSGCVQQVAIFPLNLRDYISYIFRQVAMDQALTTQSAL